MAAGRGNMEIMDSEDEPLTSSPVNVSDASADKPSAATSVQSHDAQDARQVDAHQTSAEHSTNITEERINGMDVDQEDVPVDVQLSQIDSTNVQPSTIPDMTSQPLPDTVNVTVERTGPADFKMADAQGTDYQAHTETDSGPISEHPVTDADQTSVGPTSSTEPMDSIANRVSASSKEFEISQGGANAQQSDEHVTPVDQVPSGPTVNTDVVSPAEQPQVPIPEHDSFSHLSEQAHDTSNGLSGLATSNVSQAAPKMDVDSLTQITTASQTTTFDAPEPIVTQPAAPKTPQEITLAELKAQKVALLASLAALPAVQVLIEENAALDADTAGDEPTENEIMTVANKMVKDHIKLLHEYNELKDVGQGLMGLIADQRGVRIVEVNEEFGIDVND